MNLTTVRYKESAMETKETILKKALDMFAKSGYDSVSIRDIATLYFILTCRKD